MKSSTLGFWLPMGLIVGLLWACNGNNNSKKESNETTPQKASMTSTTDSSLLHFWDKFDMNDTAQVKNPDIGEQKLADFIGLLSTTPDSALRDKAVDGMLDKAKSNRPNFDHFIKLYERYLYDGNSPMRNDIVYESVLRYLIKTDLLSDLEKEAYRPIYKLLLRNKAGQLAEDFSYELANGKKQKLSQTKGKYTFLLFYDPECSHCKETIHQLRDTPQLVQLFEQQQVQVLAIDPWGDRNKWKDYMPEISEKWINGFDSESKILSFNLYDLKASPTIYLLDENKRVLLKDTYLQPVIQYFVQPKP
ncbi:DUF5106 domain-containing protein [Sphingobacterium sp. DR205]|uniref:DUF5106 domain-containing protein n=1 Tax=Sphingobacterium sp. DR205 TaxID=2713573 RepID=UPI0013E41F5C|nr:DUF5106 domain-containing protein [Sphingobacterium sp. DR205]QIH31555.1 DUF5106 domain-containing protein [Sphingobacterium sp. DR205]